MKQGEGGRFCAADVAGVGITNQRETTVVWDRTTGKPLHNAIVWLDLRTAETVAQFATSEAGGQDRFRAVCGLPLSTYFSGVWADACIAASNARQADAGTSTPKSPAASCTCLGVHLGMKLRWLLDNVAAVKEAAAAGTALFGTIESWLIWNMSGGVEVWAPMCEWLEIHWCGVRARRHLSRGRAGGRMQGGVHVSDVSNASRTMLMVSRLGIGPYRLRFTYATPVPTTKWEWKRSAQDLASCTWHPPTCEALGIPLSMLPKIVSNAELYADIRHGALAGCAERLHLGMNRSMLTEIHLCHA
jgi:glycerol kinase